MRTYEINRRLAEQFDIHQVFAAFPGVTDAGRDPAGGEHLGPRRGGLFAAQLGYFAHLPWYVRRHSKAYDLVVEDFGAPFGSVGVPWWSETPTLAVVQWLFADAKSREYHLPFRMVENMGVRSHRRFIAVSQGIAEELRERNPRALVDVVANGLPDEVLGINGRPTGDRADIVFLGRLDIDHKGLDLLLDAFARIASRVSQDLIISGIGDGEAWLRTEIARRGLDGRIRLIGRTPTDDRFDLLREADVVAMPSRYESFGMVAAEAAAVGTPVVAFDIPCLRDLVPSSTRVPALDVALYAAKLEQWCNDPQLRGDAGRDLPETVAHLSWDVLAAEQADLYLDAMGRQSDR